MPTVPHINKCIFRHLAPEIGHFSKNLITTSVLRLLNSLRFENQSREVPHTARLFKIASQRQSCRLNMLNRHDCHRRDVRLGNPSRKHTAPITPDCLRYDGRDASDRRQSGGVRRVLLRANATVPRECVSLQQVAVSRLCPVIRTAQSLPAHA